MVLNAALRRIPPALRLLLWCALGTALVQLVLARVAPGNPAGNPFNFSPIFWYLLSAYDAHGNLLLGVIAVIAFLLRREPAVLRLVRAAGEQPWSFAAVALALFAAGANVVYGAYPLSMDEYVAVFQAQAFAAGRLGGQFPPELLDQLLPRFPPNYFFTASRLTGEVAGSYWPGFALLVAPFAGLGVPWMANPVISALTLPLVHRLALQLSGSREAAGWALLFTLASPEFVVSAMSFYAMPAHMLCNLAYALLLLQATPLRALLAGIVGSLALTLHNPAPHLLFAAAFGVWLLARRTPLPVLAALAAGYLPLVALLGFGWQQHLAALAAAAGAATGAGTPAAAAPGPSIAARLLAVASSAITLPSAWIVEARIAGLSKSWSWGAAGLLVLAAWGYAVARRQPGVNVLAAALAVTFLGYFLVPADQGHGWGYRYLRSAWFVLPVLAALALAAERADAELRQMAGWAVVLSLLIANGLRLAQVDAFIGKHLAQVPPLAQPADPARPEIVFVDPRAGAYTRDMVRNDPLLRGPRMTMVYDGPDKTAELMARRFPGYARQSRGAWGERWVK
jgi:hypothetical protein